MKNKLIKDLKKVFNSSIMDNEFERFVKLDMSKLKEYSKEEIIKEFIRFMNIMYENESSLLKDYFRLKYS